MEPNMDFPDLDFSDRSFLVQTMDEYAAALGEEALKAADTPVPEELDRACLDLVRRTAKPHSKRLIRACALLAASISLLILTLIIADAAGAAILGGRWRWDDDYLYMGTIGSSSYTYSSRAPVPGSSIDEAMLEAGLPLSLAPTWIPEDCTLLASDIYQRKDEATASVYYSRPGKPTLSIDIASSKAGHLWYISKDKGDPESYIAGDRMFYLYTNAKRWCAVWTDGQYEIFICGCVSREELLQIVDSIEGSIS